MALPSPAQVFGYDAELLAELPAARRSAIQVLAEAWLISSAALAAAVGYTLWLVEQSLPLALVVALGMWLVVVNLLRTVIAGGGAAPHQSADELSEYRPALGPLVVLSVFALLLAQPAQLPLWDLERSVDEHRALLLAEQARVEAGSSASTLAGAAVSQYPRSLARSRFFAFRVQQIWKQPQRAFLLTLSYWLLVLLPSLAGRFLALGALREYEQLRWRAARTHIVHAARVAAGQAQGALTPYPTYNPRPLPNPEPWRQAAFLSRASRAAPPRASESPPGWRWPWSRRP